MVCDEDDVEVGIGVELPCGARGRGRNCVSDVMVSGLTAVLLTVDADVGEDG